MQQWASTVTQPSHYEQQHFGSTLPNRAQPRSPPSSQPNTTTTQASPSLLPSPPLPSPPSRPRLKRVHASGPASPSSLGVINEDFAEDSSFNRLPTLSTPRLATGLGIASNDERNEFYRNGSDAANDAQSESEDFGPPARKRKKLDQAFSHLSLDTPAIHYQPTLPQHSPYDIPTHTSASANTSSASFQSNAKPNLQSDRLLPLNANLVNSTAQLPVTPPLQQGNQLTLTSPPPARSHAPTPVSSPTRINFSNPSLGFQASQNGFSNSKPAESIIETAHSTAKKQSAVEEDDVRMGNGPSSFDISPHRIFVASLSDDDEDESNSISDKNGNSEVRDIEDLSGANEISLHPALNRKIAPSPLPPEIMKNLRNEPRQEMGLVLYRPLKLVQSAEQAAETEQEIQNFRRQQQQIEAEEAEEPKPEEEAMDLDE